MSKDLLDIENDDLFQEEQVKLNAPEWGGLVILVAFIAAIIWGVFIWFSSEAKADDWDLEAMNKTVNQTNFIVDKGCSGTLISMEYRLVLTNHHCIQYKVQEITKRVTQPDGSIKSVTKERLLDVPLEQHSYANYRRVASSTYNSVIVARKKDSDMALLQIRAEEIPHNLEAPLLPDGEKLSRGQKVVIVGNPAGLDATVLMGIISSTNRLFRVPWANNEEVPFIQVSGGIFGGNSGGALFSNEGKFIGIPAAAIPGSNLGFVIPVTAVKEFLKESCYSDIWDKEAMNHEDCVADKKAEAEKKKRTFYQGSPSGGIEPDTCENSTFIVDKMRVYRSGVDPKICDKK